jgi:hypothetical protein
MTDIDCIIKERFADLEHAIAFLKQLQPTRKRKTPIVPLKSPLRAPKNQRK